MAHLLVAEDEPDHLMMLEFALTMAGHTMLATANGQAALDAARSGSFDLVILDVRLPIVGGLEVTRRLRALPAYAETKIIVMSGLAMPDDIDAGIAAGADLYLTKPFAVRELRSAVAALLPD